MKTSKILITSLLAAAAMGADAFAEVYSEAQTLTQNTTFNQSSYKIYNGGLAVGTYDFTLSQTNAGYITSYIDGLSGSGNVTLSRTNDSGTNSAMLWIDGDCSNYTGTISANQVAHSLFVNNYLSTRLLLGSNSLTGGLDLSGATVNVGAAVLGLASDVRVKSFSTTSASQVGVVSGTVSTTITGGTAGTIASNDANATPITTGTIPSRTITVTTSATLTGTTFLAGVNLTFESGATGTLSGITMNTGSITSAGNLTISGTSSLKDIAVTGGTFNISSGTANIAGTTTVSGGTLTLSGTSTLTDAVSVTSGELVLSGTANIAGTTTVSGGALDLSGGTITLANTIANSGTVTVSSGTIFVLDGLTASEGGVYSLVSGGTVTNTAGDASFSRYGAIINSERVSVGTSGGYSVTVTNYSDLVWNGGANGTWDRATSNWTSATAGSSVSFENGDSVTFGTENAEITVSGTVNPAAMTVSENTTFKGTDATISVAKDSLTISGSATLGIDSGVTLDLGSDSDAIGASDAKLNLSGSGTVKYVFTGTNGTGSGVFIADTFTGTLDYYGNLNWSQYAGGSPISFSDSVTVRLSKAEGQTSAGFWGGADRTFKNDFIFGSDYEINLGGGNLTFEGSVTTSGGALSITGSNTLTLAGSGTMTATISSMAAGSSLTLEGTGDKSTIALSGSKSISGNLTIGNATVDASASGDIFNYSVGQTQTIILNAGGELALGAERQSFCSKVDFVLKGGKISGTGADNQGYALDFYQENTVKVEADSEISANMTIRGGADKTLAFNVDDSATLTISGNILTPSSASKDTNSVLVKQGAGTLVLSGTNTYNQGTRIEAGTVEVRHANGLGTNTVNVTGNAKLALGEGLGISNNISIADSVKLTLGGGYSVALNGAITGSGTLRADMLWQTVALGGDNSGFSGAVEVVGSTVDAAHASALGTGMVKISSAVSTVGETTVPVSGSIQASTANVELHDVAIGLVETDSAALRTSSSGSFTVASGVTLYLDVSLLNKTSWSDEVALMITAQNAITDGTFFNEVLVGTFDSGDNWINDTEWAYKAGSWDAATGTLSLISVPEPSSFGLLAGAGALALVAARRRRTKKA